MFYYFEKLLLPALAMKWQLIAEEEVAGVDCVSLTGTEPGLARGGDFSSLSSCYVPFVKLVAPKDVAERIHCYVTTDLVVNTEKGITTEMSVGRVIEMNNSLPHLPCLGHKEGALTVMTVINIKYT